MPNAERCWVVPAGTLAGREEEEENTGRSRGAAWCSLKTILLQEPKALACRRINHPLECLGALSNPVGVLGGETVVVTHGGGLQLPEGLRERIFNELDLLWVLHIFSLLQIQLFLLLFM